MIGIAISPAFIDVIIAPLIVVAIDPVIIVRLVVVLGVVAISPKVVTCVAAEVVRIIAGIIVVYMDPPISACLVVVLRLVFPIGILPGITSLVIITPVFLAIARVSPVVRVGVVVLIISPIFIRIAPVPVIIVVILRISPAVIISLVIFLDISPCVTSRIVLLWLRVPFRRLLTSVLVPVGIIPVRRVLIIATSLTVRTRASFLAPVPAPVDTSTVTDAVATTVALTLRAKRAVSPVWTRVSRPARVNVDHNGWIRGATTSLGSSPSLITAN